VQIIAATARARAERQEMLLAMVAHDVRAPIGVALGALSELGHPSLGALDAEQKALVKLASRSLQRLLRTAQNISLLARVDAGRLELSKAPADLAALVREAALRLEQAGELGEVKLELQTTSAPVHVDRERVAAALDNVLSNAARFARRRIELHVASDAGGAAVTVEDDGPGLPAGMVDPFDRVSAALASPSKTGSGFGLMVVRGILAAHGGNARAENRVDAGQVRGARFILQLPSS
jgi:signal transduction histidine kinase